MHHKMSSQAPLLSRYPDSSSLWPGSTRVGHLNSYWLARVLEPVPQAGRGEAEVGEEDGWGGLASREASLLAVPSTSGHS